MYSYYSKRTFVVTNVEKLTGFFFTEDYTEDFHCTCNPQFTQPILCQNYWLEKLKVILSVSSPSSNPGEASVLSCVSSPTCRCSVCQRQPLLSPPSLPLLLSLPQQFLTWIQLLFGILCSTCCFWIQPGCRSKRKPPGLNVPCPAHMGLTWKAFSGYSTLWRGFL